MKPTSTALAIARALYPSGIGSYHYATDEQNEVAKQRDWDTVGTHIDVVLRSERATQSTTIEGLRAALSACLESLKDLSTAYPNDATFTKGEGYAEECMTKAETALASTPQDAGKPATPSCPVEVIEALNELLSVHVYSIGRNEPRTVEAEAAARAILAKYRNA